MSEEHGHEHEHHAVNYTAIFGLLCVCTVLSILFDLYKEHMTKPVLYVLILGVAVCKATFVLLYFMHIKFERAWKYVLLAPTAVLAIALPFALAPDISFHYYSVVAPQREIAAADHAAGAHAAGGLGADSHAAPGHTDAEHPKDEAHDKHDAHDHKTDKSEAEHKEPAKKEHK